MKSKTEKKYFWDFNLADALVKNHDFVIERILESGDEQAVRWLRKKYPEVEIKKVLKKSRRLSQKSRSYWELVFGLWKSLSHRSSKVRPSGIWRY